MTVLFWLIAATMITVALMIVVLPLVRKHQPIIADETRQRNIQIARDRYAELKANKAAGGISQAQYDEQVADLELALSNDLDANENLMPASASTQGRWLAYALIAAIPLFSVLLYLKLGDYHAINRINEPPLAEDQQMSKEELGRMVVTLAAKMQAEPNNLEGWIMLGRSYKMLERHQEAVAALGNAYQMASNKPEVLLPYAEAIALSKQGNWAGQPTELVNQALAIEPQNLNALWFAAIANAQQGDKKTAINYMRKLGTLLPEGSVDKQQIQALLADADKAEDKTSATPKPAATAGASVEVDVSLAPELEKEAQAGDTVFIYAQAITGPKMPLAIVKKQASDLPIKVSLSDADSMMPAMKLSQFKQVKLMARISKTGNAMPQPGDLLGEIGQADLANSTSYRIVINHRLE